MRTQNFVGIADSSFIALPKLRSFVYSQSSSLGSRGGDGWRYTYVQITVQEMQRRARHVVGRCAVEDESRD